MSVARGGVTAALVAVGLAGFCGFARAAPAAADAACQSGAVTFTSPAPPSERCYTVPADVSRLAIRAVGGKGGDASDAAGGMGAVVTGDLPVTAGETLYVEVGANAAWSHGSAGAGGGLASDVRTVSCGSPCKLLGEPSLDSRLLVAAGGGGGGGTGFGVGRNAGGAGGSAVADTAGDGSSGTLGTEGVESAAGLGGDGGTALAGGRGGGSGGTADAGDGAAGGLGVGGAGGASGGGGIVVGTGGAGGGGGGGYYGGGGGGGGGALDDGAGGGGGGAGSSFVAPSLTGRSFAVDMTGVPEVQITPIPTPVVSLDPATGLSFPGRQPVQTSSDPQTLTLTDTGDAPLEISGVTLGGTDPGDFVLGANGCTSQIAPGASCTLQVSFTPQAQGPRSATLQIASNALGSPVSVPLSGTATVPDPPVATISSPADGQSFAVGQSVTASFSCTESRSGGPGISSCTDSNGASGGTGTLDTTSPGTFTYTVTATSKDGQSTKTSISYDVTAAPAPPPTPVVVPASKPVTISAITISQVKLTGPTITWCKHCTYPNTRLTFNLSAGADIRLGLMAKTHGRFKQVATTTLHGHRGHNSFRVGGRWHGQLVPHRTMHILVDLRQGTHWTLVKTLKLTVHSPYTTEVLNRR